MVFDENFHISANFPKLAQNSWDFENMSDFCRSAAATAFGHIILCLGALGLRWSNFNTHVSRLCVKQGATQRAAERRRCATYELVDFVLAFRFVTTIRNDVFQVKQNEVGAIILTPARQIFTNRQCGVIYIVRRPGMDNVGLSSSVAAPAGLGVNVMTILLIKFHE